MINNTKPYYNPGKLIQSQITTLDNDAGMSEFESAFICGLIKDIKPKRILEIGISSGNTTAIIMKCIDLLNLNDSCEIISIGKDEVLPDTFENHTGFLINETELLIENKIKHRLVLNDYLPDCINAIGNNINFVIINTQNTYPNILLVFLTIYPLLNPNAVVVLRGINAHKQSNNINSFNAKLLLNVVVADKITPDNPDDYNNATEIGAFMLNNETDKNIQDCFGALSLIRPPKTNKDETLRFRDFISSYYSHQLLKIFDAAFEQNKILYETPTAPVGKICKSYKIGLAITFVPRIIRDYIRRKKTLNIPDQRSLLKHNARKTAKRYNLKKKSYIYSIPNLKAKFYLPLFKDDFIQQYIIYNKTYFEHDKLQFITQKWCNGLIGREIKNNILLDIGSNIGNHTLYFVLECDAKLVHCFEPIKSTFQILETNTKINKISNRVCLHNVAVGKCNGTATIEHYERENIGGTVLKEENKGDISVVSIDELGINDNICLVKIDVEGFEKNVIDGMIQTIKKCHPYIMIEIQERNFQYILNILQSFDYSFIHLGGIDYMFFPQKK